MTAGWRGDKGVVPVVEFYSHRTEGIFYATDYVVSLTTRKALHEPAGAWTIKLKSTPGVGVFGRRVDWQQELRDDDWVTVQIVDPERGRQLILLGLVDTVRRRYSAGPGGARIEEYTVVGRDWVKPLVETPLIWMPQCPFDPALDFGVLYGLADAVSTALERTSPDAAFKEAFWFLLRTGRHRKPDRKMWVLPPNLRLFDAAAKDAERLLDPGEPMQVGDAIVLDGVDVDLEGQLASPEVIVDSIQGGQTICDVLRELSNEPLNELIFDLRYPSSRPGDAASFAVSGFDLVPSAILRERPFPAYESTTPGRPSDRRPTARWRALPQ